jgi:hypothetical protein
VSGSRRQPNVDGGRTKRYVVKVSGDEEAQLESLAIQQQVTVSRLMVEMALRRDLGNSFAHGLTETEKGNFRTALWQLQRHISGCAVNINQVAKHANQTSSFPADAWELMLVTREILVRIDELVAEFSPPSLLSEARKQVSAKVVFLDKGWADSFPARLAELEADSTDIESTDKEAEND